MRNGLLLLMTAVFLLGAAGCVTETKPVLRPVPADIPARIEQQQRRISEEVASGKLTAREAAVLRDNLDWIRSRYAKAAAQGTPSPREEQWLHRMLDQNSDMIYRKKESLKRLY